MAWAPLAAAALPIVAGAIGGKAASKDSAAAQKIRDKAAAEIYGLDIPDIADLQYTPEKSAYAGDVDPALLSNMQDIESEYGNISGDPRFVQAQYQSLGGLDDIINNGGLTASDKLAYQQATDDASMQASREAGNITRDMAERGMGGSGMELAQRLASSQGAANRGAAAAQTQVATAQQRALDAMMQRGQMAGNMQSADFDRQSKAAAAKDAIQQFNRNNAMTVQQGNVNATNNANTGNRDARQGNNNVNAQIANTGKQANVNAVQDRAGMLMNKATAGANASAGQATGLQQRGQATANMYSGIASAIPGVANAAAGAYKDYNTAESEEEKRNKLIGSAFSGQGQA